MSQSKSPTKQIARPANASVSAATTFATAKPQSAGLLSKILAHAGNDGTAYSTQVPAKKYNEKPPINSANIQRTDWSTIGFRVNCPNAM